MADAAEATRGADIDLVDASLRDATWFASTELAALTAATADSARAMAAGAR